MGMSLIRHNDKESSCLRDLHGSIFHINHTGQEHCGIVTLDGGNFSRGTKNGLVRELKISRDLGGYCGVGSVGKLEDHQPIIFETPPRLPRFALTFDGFIINRNELKEGMGSFLSQFDAELAGRTISEGKDIPDGINRLSERIRGHFCLGIITEDGTSYIARSPLGIAPLMSGEGKRGYGYMTESRAFRKIGMQSLRDVPAGDIQKIDDYGITDLGNMGNEMKMCSFRYGYYSWIDSVIHGIPVSDIRERVMKKLVERDTERGLIFDFVTAIEDSGKAYGEGYALHSVKPYKSAVIKYPYGVRSYDKPEGTRGDEASDKVSTVDARIKDKIMVLCDDSVRRGTVIREPIKLIKSAGSKGIHLRIGTPRNDKYCIFDFRTVPDNTLLANRYPTDEKMADFLGVDSVAFPELEDFVSAIEESARVYKSNITRKDLCFGCYKGGDFGFLE